jgi:bifunctional DNA-binding transcriptional regulator/antitoxin component of YhaV-PrlF toxin-antitoxin module
MIEKKIHYDRMLKPTLQRKVIQDRMFKISIPTEWARYFHIQKGQAVDLELTEDGFIVKIGAQS